MPQLSIIVVSYNGKCILRQCLESVYQDSTGSDAEVIIVDNNSEDGSAEMVEQEFPQSKLIRNPSNYGFAKAVNIGIRASSSAFCLLLNSDAVLLQGALESLLACAASHPEAGAVGGLTVDSNGMPDRFAVGRKATLWRVFCHGTGLAHLFGGRYPFSGLYSYSHMDELNEVEWASGAFLLLRKEAVAGVGLLDERYFMYGEDLDLCMRLREAGWKAYHLPAARVIHAGGASLKKVRDPAVLAAIARSKALSLRAQLGKSYYLATMIMTTGLICRLVAYGAVFAVTRSAGYARKYSRIIAHLRVVMDRG